MGRRKQVRQAKRWRREQTDNDWNLSFTADLGKQGTSEPKEKEHLEWVTPSWLTGSVGRGFALPDSPLRRGCFEGICQSTFIGEQPLLNPAWRPKPIIDARSRLHTQDDGVGPSFRTMNPHASVKIGGRFRQNKTIHTHWKISQPTAYN